MSDRDSELGVSPTAEQQLQLDSTNQLNTEGQNSIEMIQTANQTGRGSTQGDKIYIESQPDSSVLLNPVNGTQDTLAQGDNNGNKLQEELDNQTSNRPKLQEVLVADNSTAEAKSGEKPGQQEIKVAVKSRNKSMLSGIGNTSDAGSNGPIIVQDPLGQTGSIKGGKTTQLRNDGKESVGLNTSFPAGNVNSDMSQYPQMKPTLPGVAEVQPSSSRKGSAKGATATDYNSQVLDDVKARAGFNLTNGSIAASNFNSTGRQAQYANAIQNHVRQSQMATHASPRGENFISYVDQKHINTTQDLGSQNLIDNQDESTDMSDERFRLPGIIPQRTNVLTGAQTTYYKQKPGQWDNTFRDLVKFQVNQEKNKQQQSQQMGNTTNFNTEESNLESFEQNLLRQAKQKAQVLDPNMQPSLPVRGKPFYLNDRERYHIDRKEYFEQTNADAKHINEDNERRLQSVHMENELALSHGQRLQSSSKGQKTAMNPMGLSELERQSAYNQVRSSNFDLHKQRSQENIGSAYNYADRRGKSSQLSRQKLPTIIINKTLNESPLTYQKGGKHPLNGHENSRVTLPADMKNWKPRQAPVIDLNMNTRIPKNVSHRKNKNDFFRFLLTQNYSAQMQTDDPMQKRLAMIHGDYRMNNDVLIPRSILKKALVGGPRGRKEEEAIEKANESFRYPIMDMINGDLTGLATNSEDEEEDQFLKKDETVTGKRLHKDHMLLSPKLKDLIQSFDKYKTTQQATNSLPGSPPQEVLDQGTAVTTGLGVTQQNNKEPQLQEQAPKPILRHRVVPPTHETEQPQTQQDISNYPATANQHQLKTNPSLGGPLPPVGDEQSEASTQNTQKMKIRMARPDRGVFQTGVEVIEHEVDIPGDGRAHLIQNIPGGANLTDQQLKEMLQNLKQQKIFGFNSFDEFASDYFNRELVAVEELNRVAWLKEARKKYENRWSNGPNKSYKARKRSANMYPHPTQQPLPAAYNI